MHSPSSRLIQGNVNALELGDGEEAVFYFKIKNENASGHLLNLDNSSWSNLSTGNGRNNLEYSSSAKTLAQSERLDKGQKYFLLLVYHLNLTTL